jgi:hypothetical protein
VRVAVALALMMVPVVAGCSSVNMDNSASPARDFSLIGDPLHTNGPPGEPVAVPSLYFEHPVVAEHSVGTATLGDLSVDVEGDGMLTESHWRTPNSLRLERFAEGAESPYDVVNVELTTQGLFVTRVLLLHLLDSRLQIDCGIDGGVSFPRAPAMPVAFSGTCANGTRLAGSIVLDSTEAAVWEGKPLELSRTTTDLRLSGAVTGQVHEVNYTSPGIPFALRTELSLNVDQDGATATEHLQRWVVPEYQKAAV